MRLIIMRHAEAEPNFLNDDERQLTATGLSQARGQGKLLSELLGSVDIMAVSPLVRTQQTADCLAEYVDIEKRLRVPELVHSRTAEEAEKKIATLSCETLLIVSHMPLVASLESYLCEADRGAERGFGLAEISVLESIDPYPGNWQRICRYEL